MTEFGASVCLSLRAFSSEEAKAKVDPILLHALQKKGVTEVRFSDWEKVWHEGFTDDDGEVFEGEYVWVRIARGEV